MKRFKQKLFGEISHRLYIRIFLHGMLLIFVVSLAGVGVFALLGNTKTWHGLPMRLAKALATDMEPGEGVQVRLAASLAKVRQILGADIAVYTYPGEMVAASGVSPPPPLEEEDARKITKQKIIRHWGSKRMFLPVPIKSNVKGCYVVMDWPFGGDLKRMATGLAIIVLLVGLMSLLLARALARPLEQVTGTARQLAKGNLGARTGVIRKDEVGVLARTIDDMAAHLERRIKGEKELLANVSHEIRTPLARLKVALELCDEDCTNQEELEERFAGMAGDVGELEQLIDDVLIAARIDLKGSLEDGTFVTVRRDWVGAEKVAGACVDRFHRVHPSMKIALMLDESDEKLFLDENLFRRALDNLLDNAVKYSEGPGTVEFRVANEKNQVVFEVLDRGIGVGEEDLPNLFEPFYRSERSRSRQAGGTGLGLTLCLRISEAHGASITALNREGGGMIFRISLPRGTEQESKPSTDQKT